ncbi:MAG: hypothetical protein QOK29_2521 [Rhodospirillaceae bacterium]|jgi:AcrR family transcriptional regulator|nr:hypothetical protein [Rhodospirillaceae bacterium]
MIMPAKRTKEGVSPKRQSARRADTRRAIIEATIDLLVEEGFAATTIRSVSGRAGSSVGAVQYHFPTKQALLLETLAEIFQEVPQILGELIGAEVDWRRCSRQLVRTLWAFYSGRRYLAGSEILLGTRMSPGGNESILQKRDVLEDAYRQAWTRIVRSSPLGQKEGFTLLKFITAVLRGLAVMAVHEHDEHFFKPQLAILEGVLAEALESGRLPGQIGAKLAPVQRSKNAKHLLVVER